MDDLAEERKLICDAERGGRSQTVERLINEAIEQRAGLTIDVFGDALGAAIEAQQDAVILLFLEAGFDWKRCHFERELARRTTLLEIFERYGLDIDAPLGINEPSLLR